MGSTLRERLSEGRALYGTFASFPDPRFVEYLGHAGLDWIMLDAEHDGLGVDTSYLLAIAARSVGMAVVVRAPSGVPDIVGRYADIGVDAIICPHVRSVESAQSFVAATRFPPNGTRGVAGGARASGYGLRTTAREYFTDPARLPMPAALLEDVEAYEHLDDILGVPGLEIACLGVGDLAGSLGVPGVADDPRVAQLVAEAVPKISAAGIHISAAVPTPQAAAEWYDKGARLLVVPVAPMFGSAVRQFLSAAPR